MSNITTAKAKVGGSVFVGETTATLPTDAKSELTGFTSLGHISDSGMTNSFKKTSTDFKDWSGAIVYSSQTEVADTFKMKFIDALDINVLKTVYGDDNVTGTLESGIQINATSDEPLTKALVIDEIVEGGKIMRTVVPRAKLTELEDINHTATELLGYGCTFTAYPDDNGKSHTTYVG